MKSDNKQAFIWAIGGSDCNAGAGIQADIKAAQKLAVYCSTVVTAVTVQNSQGVSTINPVALEIFSGQILALAQDGLPQVIKIGLLASTEQVLWLSDWLQRLEQQNKKPQVIFDPVVVAGGGERLTQQDTRQALTQFLLLRVDVLTANWHEALWLTDSQGNPDSETLLARLQQLPVNRVLLKGGHGPNSGQSIDWLLDKSDVLALSTKRITGVDAHGTGCTMASALAAALVKGLPLKEAFVLAKALVFQGIQNHLSIGDGAPKLGLQALRFSAESFPQYYPVQEAILPTAAFARCNTKQLGLYPVVDSLVWVERLLNYGVKTLQLRIKTGDMQFISEQIRKANQLARAHQARLFINDYWQLAIEHHCYGVHLGQEDLDSADLTAIQKAGLRLGISTHGYYELLRAMSLRPSYIAIGAIFATNTKDMSGQIQGTEKLHHLVQLAKDYPLVAIGGINLARAPEVLSTGVGSVAVVSAITQAHDPQESVRQFRSLLQQQGIANEPEQY
ncbi:thiamine phosphate synthase [Planctobacterium marinum]|uniref:thiamine phosphate synthase n=1 Tax=Planctobacterium marinum TaxID=1631968 RepID=UPI001E53A3DF|nr:thiamine phosphate synthase [Planctobacterium marinum]MCC2607148.1 thiamine phosphate synthase [Planctobacterium marinum]